MQETPWDEIDVGDVIEVRRPLDASYQPYRFIVTDRSMRDVIGTRIELGEDDEPLHTPAFISREKLREVQDTVARITLHKRPEFRQWRGPGLRSFGVRQPRVPTGLTLAGLVRYNDGQFVVTDQPAGTPGFSTACFMPPFYDAATRLVNALDVTVFRLASGALERKQVVNAPNEYRYFVPEGLRFARAARGHMLSFEDGGMVVRVGGKLQFFTANAFAVETDVLKRAGVKRS